MLRLVVFFIIWTKQNSRRSVREERVNRSTTPSVINTQLSDTHTHTLLQTLCLRCVCVCVRRVLMLDWSPGVCQWLIVIFIWINSVREWFSDERWLWRWGINVPTVNHTQNLWLGLIQTESGDERHYHHHLPSYMFIRSSEHTVETWQKRLYC